MERFKKFLILCALGTILNIEPVSSSIEILNATNEYGFVAFIGTKLTVAGETINQEIREVVGIGAIIGIKQILTTQEYLKWRKLPNIEYYVLFGTHDFDRGGREMPIKEVINAPQNNKAGPHTICLLILKIPLQQSFATKIIFVDDQFVQGGTKMEMVSIYQRESIRLGRSNEAVLANKECARIFGVDGTNNSPFKNFGSYSCLQTNNMVKSDCLSHIGSISFFRTNNVFYLIGIKSGMHHKCGRPPYTFMFQRITPHFKWLKDNIQL